MPNRTVVIAFSGISLIGALAGCAAPAPQPSATSDAGPSPAPAAPSVGTTPPEVAAGTLPDGTYTADGEYLAPSGPESVTVTVSVADGTVTAVEVVGHARDPQAKRHQGDFSAGIAAVVVGRPIADLMVDRVAGSSVTGRGFNAALDAIRAGG